MWDGCCDADRDLLESLQFEAARLVTGALKGTRRESLLNETGWSTLKARRNDHKLFMMYKIVNNLAPPYLSELRPDNVSSRSNRSLRANDNLIVPFARTERYKKSFYISSPTANDEDLVKSFIYLFLFSLTANMHKAGKYDYSYLHYKYSLSHI